MFISMNIVKLTIVWCLLAGLFVSAQAGESDALENKAIFKEVYPKGTIFRWDNHRASNASYEAWARYNDSGSGVIKKIVPEEFKSLDSERLIEWSKRYVKENPTSLMLMHYNGEARQTRTNAEVHDRYFPGHWVYLPGGMLLDDIDAGETTFKVSDASSFSMEAYREFQVRPMRYHANDAVIVPVNEDGTKDWYQAEFVNLQGLDKESGTLTVKRGMYFSKSRSFAKGRAYVAPLQGGVWGGGPIWFYNYATTCPKDRNGKQAWQVHAEELTEMLRPEGKLAHLDGIAFDVVKWGVGENWDLDVDGQPDHEVVDGAKVYRDGCANFLLALREGVGPNKVLTADSYNEESQRMVGVLNGSESEGLVKHNDAFRGFGQFLNTYRYWDHFNPLKYRYSYLVPKVKFAKDVERIDQFLRMNIGSGCILGLGTVSNSVADGSASAELTGNGRGLGWLGKPVGPMINLAELASEGAVKPRIDARFVEQLKTENCEVELTEENGLLVRGTSQDPFASSKITFPKVEGLKGDLSVFVESKSLVPLSGMPDGLPIPRFQHMTATGLPNFGEGKKLQAYYARMFGLISHKEFFRNVYYFRRAGESKGGAPELTLEIEEQGGVLLRNLEYKQAAPVILREFEHGIVIVNPALHSVSLDLTEYFPGVGCEELVTGKVVGMKSVEVPALDAVFLVKP